MPLNGSYSYVYRAQGVYSFIIDTGILPTHTDFGGRVNTALGYDALGGNKIDCAGHGTHVAGLVAAQANNGQGVVGVASCANVKIMPVRVLNDEGSGSSLEIERGVKWAVDHGVTEITIKGDSLLIIEQMRGNYKVKNEGLKPLHMKARMLVMQIGADETQPDPPLGVASIGKRCRRARALT